MNARNWPLLRQRPEPRHGGLPRAKETPMPSSFAASLPLHITEPAPAPAPETPPEPEKIVRCGNCNAMGPSSLIPDIPTRGPRCADHDACTDRWYTGKPVSLLPHVAEALEPLPEDAPAPAVHADITDAAGDVMRTWAPPAYAQEAVDRHLATRGEEDAAEPEDAADAAQEASTEALARWAPGQDLSEDEGPREDAAEPPADTTEPAPGAEAEAEPAPEGEVQP